MNRCHSKRARLALAALLSLSVLGVSAPTASLAQEAIKREVPRDVVLGQMTVVAPPVIQMNGQSDRLSPGVRIRNLRNFVVLSGSLAGHTLPVVYKRDMTGLVQEAWILSTDEYAQLSAVSADPRKYLAVLGTIFSLRQ